MAAKFLAKAAWHSQWMSAGAVMASLAACAVGPDYKKPTADAPPAYKESQGWKIGEPQQAGSDTAWWSIYNDAALDVRGAVDRHFEENPHVRVQSADSGSLYGDIEAGE